jgi:hypothetical protein
MPPVTTKTEFARYLDAHEEAIPSLKSYLSVYRKTDHRLNSFGTWLRVNRDRQFKSAFENWWLKRPKLFGVIYAELEQNQPT